MKYNINEMSLSEMIEVKEAIESNRRFKHYGVIKEFEEAVYKATKIMDSGMFSKSLGSAYTFSLYKPNSCTPYHRRFRFIKEDFVLVQKLNPEYSWKDVMRVIRRAKTIIK